MGKVMRHTLGASLNIRHNLSSSKGPKPLQLKLLTSLHFHAVHFMRTLPTGSVDPNFGRRVRNRRQLNSLQNTWPYGHSMPIAVRYTQDAFSRSGWLWPVDAKGEPLK